MISFNTILSKAYSLISNIFYSLWSTKGIHFIHPWVKHWIEKKEGMKLYFSLIGYLLFRFPAYIGLPNEKLGFDAAVQALGKDSTVLLVYEFSRTFLYNNYKIYINCL